jgi:Cdc6-like AAA superfamily ATPase
LGWIIIIAILSLLVFLRDKFIKLYERLWNAIYWNVIYKKLSGTRLFRRIALKRYAQTLEKQYSKIPVPFIKDRPLILKDVYVPLRVAGSLTGAKIDSMEAVNEYPHLMITGTPGSGKSTLLKHILLSFISGVSAEVPILLELNRMNTSDKSLREELIEVLNRNNFPNGENLI